MTDRQRGYTRRHPCANSNCQSLSPCARLVGHGFRLWLSGCKTGELSYWEKAWQLYSGILGPREASAAMAELSSWVRAVNATSTREIDVLAENCSGFCRDECLALAMISACQHKTCPAMRACAFALVDTSIVDEVVDCSERFAATLVAVEQVLPPSYIVNAAAMNFAPEKGYVQ